MLSDNMLRKCRWERQTPTPFPDPVTGYQTRRLISAGRLCCCPGEYLMYFWKQQRETLWSFQSPLCQQTQINLSKASACKTDSEMTTADKFCIVRTFNRETAHFQSPDLMKLFAVFRDMHSKNPRSNAHSSFVDIIVRNFL